MNFSSSLMSGMGISLGGLEIATDFLYSNSEFYDTELTEVKTDISSKKTSSSKVINSTEPQINEESIIQKFDILKTHIKSNNELTDTESDMIMLDFDDTLAVDFDSLEESEDVEDIEDIETSSIEEYETSDFEQVAEANAMLAKIQSAVTNSYEEEQQDDITFTLDDLDNLDDSLLDEEEQTYEEEQQDEEEFDSQLLADIDSLFNEDEEETTETPLINNVKSSAVKDTTSNNESDTQNEDDILSSIDDLFLEDEEYTPSNDEDTPSKDKEYEEENDLKTDTSIDEYTETSENKDELQFDFEEEDFEEDFEEETASDEEEEQFSLDDLLFEDEDTEEEIKEEIENTEVKNKSNIVNDKPNNIANNKQQEKEDLTSKDIELKMLREEMAAMRKAMQELTNANTSKNASEKEDIKSKNFVDVDIGNTSKKPKSTPQEIKKPDYSLYTAMPIDSLYIEVKKYMTKLGVSKKLVDISVLNKKFGEQNIRKLIHKSYLIKVGKGVTVGR